MLLLNLAENFEMGANVLFNIENGIATITLNRPEFYNAISQELKTELLDALDVAKNDDDVKCIILTGAGKGFCAGADMSVLASKPSPYDVRDDLTSSYGPIIRRIVEMHKPVICAINGPIAGAGIGFGLACDYKVMAEHASLRFAFVNIGLVSDAGSTWFLTREVGYTKALEIIYGGKKVPAKECFELGIVNKVVPIKDLMQAAHELAADLMSRPPLAFAATKKAIRHTMTHGLFESLAYEADLQMGLIVSEDHREGVAAFLEKRKPSFKGK